MMILYPVYFGCRDVTVGRKSLPLVENWDVPEIGGMSGRAILSAQLEACEQLLVLMYVSCEALMPTVWSPGHLAREVARPCSLL